MLSTMREKYTEEALQWTLGARTHLIYIDSRLRAQFEIKWKHKKNQPQTKTKRKRMKEPTWEEAMRFIYFNEILFIFFHNLSLIQLLALGLVSPWMDISYWLKAFIVVYSIAFCIFRWEGKREHRERERENWNTADILWCVPMAGNVRLITT